MSRDCVGVMVYDSRSPFPVAEPPVALTERMKTAVAGIYLAGKALEITQPELGRGAMLAAKVIEEELARYEAEMTDWQAKLARKARELAASNDFNPCRSDGPASGDGSALVEPDSGARHG